MKTVGVFITLWLATAAANKAQVIHPALNDDPVFYKVLYSRIDYPRMAASEHLYGRIYAGFRIDEKGRINDITILSPGNTKGPDNIKSGFEYEVSQALKHMPSLNPQYAGNYALPIAFCLINRDEDRKLIHKPVNQLDEQHLGDRLLLREYTCTIGIASKFGPGPESKEVWGYYASN